MTSEAGRRQVQDADPGEASGRPPAAGLRRIRSEVPAMEPSQAYRRLAAHRPFMLDGMGAHPEARHAYVACTPAVEVRLDAAGMTLRHEDGAEERRDGDPLQLLRTLTDAYRFDVDEPEGFTGGFVGVFHHEFLHAIERDLPRPDAGGHDAVLWLCRDAWVLDRRTGRAWLWCADLSGETGAGARATRILAALRAGSEPALRAGGDAPDPMADRMDGAGPARGGQGAQDGQTTRATATGAPGPGPAADASDLGPIEDTWRPSLDRAAFAAQVRRIKDLIRRGDHYQTNLATRWSAPCAAAPVDLYERLAASNPSPYMALIETGDEAIVSCSPEQLFAVQDGTIRSRPIAGTRPRDADPERDGDLERQLLQDPKEQAEHTMLVDLVRNDVSKVAVPGSVRVAERMSVERYRHVMHLVSRVEGTVRPGTGFVDWLAALFPGGTVTGAPKHRACRRIAEAEPVPRGPYTGSAGTLSWSHNAHWNILIRTLVLRGGKAHVHAGSGIVADSDPGREWEEAGHKARALLQAAKGRTGGGSRTRLGEVSRHGAWEPPTPRKAVDARVLLVDNYDSFTHNLADYCAALGAEVTVLRNDRAWRRAAAGATHIILSPGPGRPEEAGCCEAVVGEARVPVLGVCLGHQAMATATGAAVVEGEPVHGKPALARHHGAGLFAGLPDPLVVTRYHSLVVDAATLGPTWAVDAWLEDGTVMAMRHRERPLWGLQFHPESICTDRGLELIQRFLET